MKGDSDQRRIGRGGAENKPPFFERGNTDLFKAQIPKWLAKKKRWGNANPTAEGKGGQKGRNNPPGEKEKGIQLSSPLRNKWKRLNK